MPKPIGSNQKSCPDDEFIQLFKSIGPTATARHLGCSERSVFKRRNNLARFTDITTPGAPGKEYPQRNSIEIQNGCVLIGSDFHLWPGAESVALKAFKKFCKDEKPSAVILNGDVLDFPQISRHPPIGWQTVPTVLEEIEAAQDHLNDIVKAVPRNCHKIWTVGNHDCLDSETECLTQRGWINYEDLMKSDKVLSLDGNTPVWSEIDEIISFPYSGEMIKIEKTRFSMLVTPNHRVLLNRLNWRSRKYDIQEYRAANNLPYSFNVPMSGEAGFKEVDIPDDAISLVGWLLTDGHFSKYDISLYQSKPLGIIEIERILKSLKLKYVKSERQRERRPICGRELLHDPLISTTFRIKAKGGSVEIVKRWLPKKGVLPEWAHRLSSRQFEILLEALIGGDGCWDGSDPSKKTCSVLYGTEPILSSIQAAAVCHGWRARLAIDNRGDYRLCLTKEDKLRIEKSAISKSSYNGIVWCLRVPFTNFMVRRNGSAYFTGNCRFETRLATVANEFKGLKGTTLEDHFPIWKRGWSVWINNDVVVKHRFRGGIHAVYANTLNAGKTMVTGHLHSQKVTPFTDYNGTRYGVDAGCIASTDHQAFTDYTEDNPKNWISGFVVLTFKDGRLMYPELVSVWDDDAVQFRGQIIKV